MTRMIDINCDLGEGMQNDEALMPYISTCNIACGGHYGNTQTISDTIKLAKKHGVRVGAHPSFPDKEHFGRRRIQINDDTLIQSILEQVTDFKQVCKTEGVKFSHVKLHGALYNIAAKWHKMANLVIEALRMANLECQLFAPYHSVLAEVGKAHFEISNEAFIDRSYHQDLSLVDRSHPKAVINSPENAWQQLHEIWESKSVTTIEGKKTIIQADTFCIHGDNANVLDILTYIHNQLNQQQILFKKDLTSNSR